MKILGKYITKELTYNWLRRKHKNTANIWCIAAIVVEIIALIGNIIITAITNTVDASFVAAIIGGIIRIVVFWNFLTSVCNSDDLNKENRENGAVLSFGTVIFLLIVFCISLIGSVVSTVYEIMVTIDIINHIGISGVGFVILFIILILCTVLQFVAFAYLAVFCVSWLRWWRWTWEGVQLSPEGRAMLSDKYDESTEENNTYRGRKAMTENNTHNGGKEIMNGDIGKTVTGLLRKALMENIITETQFEEFTNRLEALDRLRAKCYITREEYERKANLILDDVLTIISKSEWRSGRICGTKALEIYDECCELFGWKRGLRGEFGPQRRLWAGKATPENYDVWFVSRSNINGANNDSWNNTVDNARGTITVDWHIPFEGVAGTRVTFVKNREGQYVFYGVYSCTLDYSARREICTRISDRYPE